MTSLVPHWPHIKWDEGRSNSQYWQYIVALPISVKAPRDGNHPSCHHHTGDCSQRYGGDRQDIGASGRKTDAANRGSRCAVAFSVWNQLAKATTTSPKEI